jgi:hypothetical protein
MLVEMVRLGKPVDLILFADTGGERPETYRYIDLFSNWLVERGYPEIQIVRKVRKTGEVQTLEQNCLEAKMLPSIAYGFKSCSLKYKVQPQDKFCNNWQPARDEWAAGRKVVKLIGYDAGEERRAKILEDDKYTYEYPLIATSASQRSARPVFRFPANRRASSALPRARTKSCFSSASIPTLLRALSAWNRTPSLRRCKVLGAASHGAIFSPLTMRKQRCSRKA